MKQRAKVYKGKRVVMGDKNLVTKHEIHVNDIPQQGGESGGGNSGGGGNGGSGSGTLLSKDMVYLDLSGYTVDDKTSITNGVALCAKYIDDNGSVVFVSPMLFALTDRSIWKKMNYYAICGSLLVHDYEGNVVPLIDMVNLSFPDIPRITEAEFYTL